MCLPSPGGGHRRPAGISHLRGVLRVLQDDVSEARPFPAHDGLQRPQRPPDGRGAGRVPAHRAEGQRARRCDDINRCSTDNVMLLTIVLVTM